MGGRWWIGGCCRPVRGAFRGREQVGERNVLVDPVGAEMAFGNTLLFNQKKSLFAGRKDQTRVFPKPDLIITAQQLPDHLHLPTLRLFDRATPIVSTPGGADILRAEGFTNVKSLKFTESSVELDGDLEVLATAVSFCFFNHGGLRRQTCLFTHMSRVPSISHAGSNSRTTLAVARKWLPSQSEGHRRHLLLRAPLLPAAWGFERLDSGRGRNSLGSDRFYPIGLCPR